MIEIKLPKKIKVAGFTYPIILSKRRDETLNASNFYGEAKHGVKKEIALLTDLDDDNFNNTFIHECVHASDAINNSANRMTEAQVEGIGNGLHQIFGQLGIKFVRQVK